MKTILILAYDFPPLNTIGAQRPYSWFKYFKQFGLHPVIVTRHWDDFIKNPNDYYRASNSSVTTIEESEYGSVIRAPFTPTFRDKLIYKSDVISVAIRKVLSFASLLSENHFSILDNKRGIYDAAHKFLETNEVVAIISTGEPFILFSYGQKLGQKFQIPWFADYRDGWSSNYNVLTPVQRFLSRYYFRKLERALIRSAKLVTVAAPVYSSEIAELSGISDKQVQVIYNGYFEEMFDGLEQTPEKKKFTIAHAGTLYYFQRVETFFEGLNLFLDKNPDAEIDVNFYGLNFYPSQIERIKGVAGKSAVSFTDKIPHKEMLKELVSSHLQLLVATPEKHQIYGKVFDYTASGKPTLLVENDKGPLEWILSFQENAFKASTAEEVESIINHLYTDRSKTKRLPNANGQFTRRNQTKRYAEEIKRVLKKKN